MMHYTHCKYMIDALVDYAPLPWARSLGFIINMHKLLVHPPRRVLYICILRTMPSHRALGNDALYTHCEYMIDALGDYAPLP